MARAAGFSTGGGRKPGNEDRFLVDAATGLFLVADGMGGVAGGEEAARAAIESAAAVVRRALQPEEMTWPFGYDAHSAYPVNVLRTALEKANLRLSRMAESVEGGLVGATIAALWLAQVQGTFGHLGDSRVYRLSGGALERLTEDHTLVAQQLALGLITPAQASTHALRSLVIRHLGARSSEPPPVRQLPLVPGDRWLLCSDGVWSGLADVAIAGHLAGGTDLEATAMGLVGAAREGGSQDDATAVVVEIEAREAAA
jgi:protein phosphatase